MDAKILPPEGQLRMPGDGPSGHEPLDMSAYDAYLSGRLEDSPHPEETIRTSPERSPEVNP